MATSVPPVWYSRISLSFASGVAWARKSSTPASAAMAAAVSGLSPGDHHRLDAHLAQVGEALLDAAFDDILQVDHAQRLAVARPPPAACRPLRAMPSTAAYSGRPARACHLTERAPSWHRARPCGCEVPSKSTPLMRVCAVNGMKCIPSVRHRCAHRPARAGRTCPWPAPRCSGLRVSRRPARPAAPLPPVPVHPRR